VDDEQDIRDIFSEVGKQNGFTVDTASSITEFKKSYFQFKPDIMILDLYLVEGDGIEIMRILSENYYQGALILISGYDEKVLSSAQFLGSEHGLKVIASLQKPVKLQQLTELLKQNKIDNLYINREYIEFALNNEKFVLHYQPKISLKTGTVTGVEALIRLVDAQGKVIFPLQFLPLIEETGLIIEVTDWVINRAILDLADFFSHGYEITMSINLSLKNLTDIHLPDKIEEKVLKNNLQQKNVIFEITETAAMSQPKILIDILTRLRIKGFGLSIDDFGTGYSSLVELYRMPFSELKIDKSFVISLTRDHESNVIAKAIIELAHHLEMITVAEGVEDEAAMEILKKYNCDVIQGYLISKPLPKEQLLEWLKVYKPIKATIT
jgi:sensor c-di-GMP phosphodiesterase-like protein